MRRIIYRLIGALGQRHTHIQGVCAALDLITCNLQQAVVVVGQQQLLGAILLPCVLMRSPIKWGAGSCTRQVARMAEAAGAGKICLEGAACG